MQGRLSKEQLETISSAARGAAKSVVAHLQGLAGLIRPRVAALAAKTKTADSAAPVTRAGALPDVVDLFMSEWPQLAPGAGCYGYQSPALVAAFITRQSGIRRFPFNAKDLAAHPDMAAAYDWLPAPEQAQIGDIAVYGREQGHGYGTCGVVVNLSPRHRDPVIYTQGPGAPWTVQLGTHGLLGFHRLRARD